MNLYLSADSLTAYEKEAWELTNELRFVVVDLLTIKDDVLQVKDLAFANTIQQFLADSLLACFAAIANPDDANVIMQGIKAEYHKLSVFRSLYSPR